MVDDSGSASVASGSEKNDFSRLPELFDRFICTVTENKVRSFLELQTQVSQPENSNRANFQQIAYPGFAFALRSR